MSDSSLAGPDAWRRKSQQTRRPRKIYWKRFAIWAIVGLLLLWLGYLLFAPFLRPSTHFVWIGNQPEGILIADPIPFMDQERARFLQLDAVGKIHDFSDVLNSPNDIRYLSERLEDNSIRNSDTVVIYMNVHSVTGTSGLMCQNFDPEFPAQGTLDVSALLSQVSKLPGKTKLVLLNTGHGGLASAARNDFPKNLKSATEALDDNIIVCSSHSAFERSQYSPALQTTAFGLCAMKALAGAADENHDGYVSVKEFVDFTGSNVQAWANHIASGNETQNIQVYPATNPTRNRGTARLTYVGNVADEQRKLDVPWMVGSLSSRSVAGAGGIQRGVLNRVELAAQSADTTEGETETGDDASKQGAGEDDESKIVNELVDSLWSIQRRVHSEDRKKPYFQRISTRRPQLLSELDAEILWHDARQRCGYPLSAEQVAELSQRADTLLLDFANAKNSSDQNGIGGQDWNITDHSPSLTLIEELSQLAGWKMAVEHQELLARFRQVCAATKRDEFDAWVTERQDWGQDFDQFAELRDVRRLAGVESDVAWATIKSALQSRRLIEEILSHGSFVTIPSIEAACRQHHLAMRQIVEQPENWAEEGARLLEDVHDQLEAARVFQQDEENNLVSELASSRLDPSNSATIANSSRFNYSPDSTMAQRSQDVGQMVVDVENSVNDGGMEPSLAFQLDALLGKANLPHSLRKQLAAKRVEMDRRALLQFEHPPKGTRFTPSGPGRLQNAAGSQEWRLALAEQTQDFRHLDASLYSIRPTDVWKSRNRDFVEDNLGRLYQHQFEQLVAHFDGLLNGADAETQKEVVFNAASAKMLANRRRLARTLLASYGKLLPSSEWLPPDLSVSTSIVKFDRIQVLAPEDARPQDELPNGFVSRKVEGGWEVQRTGDVFTVEFDMLVPSDKGPPVAKMVRLTYPSMEFEVASIDAQIRSQPGEFHLAPYPNQEGSFELRLTNLAKTPRRGAIEIYRNPGMTIDQFQSSKSSIAPQAAADFIARRGEAIEVVPKAVGITNGEKPTTEATEQPTTPPLSGGLFLVIEEHLGESDTENYRHIVVLSPKVVRPSGYLIPQVKTREGIVEVSLRLREDVALPEGFESTIKATVEGLDPESEQKLEAAVSAEMRQDKILFDILTDRQNDAMCFLSVDGFPSAFRIEFEDGEPKLVDEPYLALRQPNADGVYTATESIPIELIAHRKDGIAISANRQLAMNSEEINQMVFDREVDTTFSIDFANFSSLVLRIGNAVKPHVWNLPVRNWTNSEFIVRPKLGPFGSGINITIDAEKPTIELLNAMPSALVRLGTPVQIEAQVQDRFSTVSLVEASFDPAGFAEDAQTPPVEAKQVDANTWAIEINSEDLGVGSHRMSFRATDQLGNVGDSKRLVVTVLPAVPQNKASKYGILTGSIVYLDEQISDAKLLLTGGNEPIESTSESDGAFTFADLEPGDYVLKAVGLYRNSVRKQVAEIAIEAGKTLELELALQ